MTACIAGPCQVKGAEVTQRLWLRCLERNGQEASRAKPVPSMILKEESETIRQRGWSGILNAVGVCVCGGVRKPVGCEEGVGTEGPVLAWGRSRVKEAGFS